MPQEHKVGDRRQYGGATMEWDGSKWVTLSKPKAKPSPSPAADTDTSEEGKEFAGHEKSDRPTLVREGLKRYGDPGKASDFARRALEWQSKRKQTAGDQGKALKPTPTPTPR